MSGTTARLTAIALPPRPRRRTSEVDVEHESSPDRLLGHQYRPKPRRVQKNGLNRSNDSATMNRRQSKEVSDSQEQEQGDVGSSDVAEDDEGQDGVNDMSDKIQVENTRETRTQLRKSKSAQDNVDRGSESPMKINPLVDQHRAEAARRTSTGKLARPSARTQKATYAFPATRSTSVQRRLGPQTLARPDIFGLDESFERVKSKAPRNTSALSPLRKQRKTHTQMEQEQVDQQLRMETERVLSSSGVLPPRKRGLGDVSGTSADSPPRKAPKRVVVKQQDATSKNGEPTASTAGRRNKPLKRYPAAGIRREQLLNLEQVRDGRTSASAVPSVASDAEDDEEEEVPAQPIPEASQDERAQTPQDAGADPPEHLVERESATQAGEVINGSRPRSQRVPHGPIVDPDSLFLPEDGEEEEESDGRHDDDAADDGVEEVERCANAKRQARVEARQALEDVTDEESEEEMSQADTQRMYGELHNLREIYRQLRKQNRALLGIVIPKENEVNLILDICESVIAKLSRDQEAGNVDEDPVQDFIDIGERVRALYTNTDGAAPDFGNARRARSIYAHLFPQLIEVVKSMIECYESIDTRRGNRHQITSGHLKTVVEMIDVLLGLYGDQQGGAKQYRRRPTHPDVTLIQPVERICASFKSVHKAFIKALNEHARVRSQHEQRRRQVRREAADREQEEEETRQKDAYLEKYAKWSSLHMIRREVEPLYMPDSRWKINHHLVVPQVEIEEDADGFPMERVDLLRSRVGPPFAKITAARKILWSDEESNALYDGLKAYKGPMVFERLMIRYCGRYPRDHGEIQVLNKFNVTEIVTKAAELKEHIEAVQSRNGGVVEDWVLGIPEWVRREHPPGDENESPEVEDDESVDDLIDD